MCRKMGIAKCVFAILMSFGLILSVCLFNGVTANASAIPMPILPYVPPELGSMMDYIFNANGLTAPEVSEDYKIQAYADLYKRAIGAGWDSAWQTMIDNVNKSKTSGKIEINGASISALNAVMASALQNGVPAGESIPPVTDGQQLLFRMQKMGYKWTLENANFTWERLSQQSSNRKFVVAVGSHIAFISWSSATYSGEPRIQDIGNGRFRIVKQDNSFINPQVIGDLTVSSGVIQNVSYSNFAVGVGTFTWGTMPNECIEISMETADMVNISAQNATIGAGILAGTIRALSASTALNADGTIDDTKPLVIPVPPIDIVPAVTISDLSSVQEQAGVVPVSIGEDVESIRDSLQIAQGDVNDYSIDLTEYFPFCIPFDIGNLLTIFVAEPQAPVVQFVLPIGYDEENGVIFDNFEMDLSVFDEVALWVRRGMILIFIVGLGVATRAIYLRG